MTDCLEVSNIQAILYSWIFGEWWFALNAIYRENEMGASRITITLDEGLLKRLDHLVQAVPYSSRSRAIQEAVEDKLRKTNKDDFERELVKLDPQFEQEMADEGLCEDVLEWPEY